MLTDPQSVTIAGAAVSLPRTSSSENKGEFKSNDGNVSLVVSHQYGKRNRHLYRLNHKKVAADPFQGTLNALYSMSAFLVIDVPPVGYTVAQAKEVVDGFVAELTENSGALITKLVGGES